MSSTTDRARRLARTLAIAGAIAAGWFAASAAILAATDRAEAVLVVFARKAGTFALPRSVAILEWDGRGGRFVGTQPGYVRELYRAGALLVLPARGGGCLRLPAAGNRVPAAAGLSPPASGSAPGPSG